MRIFFGGIQGLKVPRSLFCGFVLIFALSALLCCTGRHTENLSPLASAPDWTVLKKYQETITHDDFTRLLQTVYCPNGVRPELIEVDSNFVRILTSRESGKRFTLRFAKTEGTRRPVRREWTTVDSLPSRTPAGPLSGVHIALDPGHIGGKWAKMEERWFQVNSGPPIQEGDLTLRVAQMIAPRLQELGAKVSLVRDRLEPVTSARPEDFEQIAKAILKTGGVTQPREDFEGPTDPDKENTVGWQRNLLFYRASEIRRRAEIINEHLRPDVVLCLHFNAEAWGDPLNPTLVDKNHFHVLVNGSYLPAELELDDERFEMMRRLLSRAYLEEIGLAENLAETLAKETQLPAYEYVTGNATKVGMTGYVYARNLLATRLYQCPTVYLEPYVMNSRDVFERVQAGDYDGTRLIGGREYPSIFREYAQGVVEGVTAYYSLRK